MTFLFDFDGTLADTLAATLQAFNQHSAEFELPMIDAEMAQTLRELSLQEVLQRYPLSPWKMIKLVTTVQAELKRGMSKVKPIAGVPEAIMKLHQAGCRLGIVSSNSTENIEIFLKNNELELFEFVHSEKNLFGKGQVLKKSIKNYQLDPKATWYIGDEVRDIEAARTAGLKAAAVSWGFNSQKRLSVALPDALLLHPHELLHLGSESPQTRARSQ